MQNATCEGLPYKKGFRLPKRLNEKDFIIVRDIIREPTIPLAELGRRLGMSHTAIRARLNRLAETGVFQGFVALPHPAYLGLQARLYTWRPTSFDTSRLSELLNVPGVVFSIADHSGAIATMVYAVDTKPPEELTRLLGKPQSSSLPRFAATRAPTLSSAAARVLMVLIDDPRASVARIASAADVSRKTARKQRDQMLENGSLELLPLLVAVAGSGVILFHIHADLDDPGEIRHLQDAAGPHAILLTVTHDPTGAYLFGRADSLLEVVQLETRVREAVGASLLVPTKVAVARDRLHEWAGQLTHLSPT